MIPQPALRAGQPETLRLIKGGKDYFDLLKELIANAKESIYFVTYIFDNDETGTAIAEALKAAARRRVAVFVLVDGYASGSLPKSFILDLRDAGIRFKRFDPLLKSKYFYLGRRLHQKVVTIDSRFSLVGGINVSNRYNDMPGERAWLDWAVYAEGEISGVLAQQCARRMQGLSIRRFVQPVRRSLRKNQFGEVKVNVNDWVKGKREITRSYFDMFRKANDRIIILSAYFLPNDQFRKRLRAAAKRGVKVQVILAGTSDIPVAKYAERFMYRWLLKNGIEIFEYQKSVLHGKMAVCDGNWATVGSYNINTISAYASIELNLAITDREFVKQAEQRMKEIMTNNCVQIESSYVEDAPRSTKVAQQAAYYLYRVLFFVFTFYFKQQE